MNVIFNALKVNFKYIKTFIHMYFKWLANFWFELYFTILLREISYRHPHTPHMECVCVCVGEGSVCICLHE